MGVFDQGGTAFKFVNEGDTVSGVIASYEESQQYEFDRVTGKPSTKLATYDNGDPIYQVVFQLDTDLREDDTDDGRRSVYVSSARAKKAVVSAVRAAKVKAPKIGGRLTVTYTGNDPSSFNGSAKAFTARYEEPSAGAPQTSTFGGGQPAGQPHKPASAQPEEPAKLGAPPAARPGQEDPWAPADPRDALTGEVRDQLAQLVGLNLPADAVVQALGGRGVTAEMVDRQVEDTPI